MIRIGDFSKLSRVPIKTLRYYDEIGLLSQTRLMNSLAIAIIHKSSLVG